MEAKLKLNPLCLWDSRPLALDNSESPFYPQRESQRVVSNFYYRDQKDKIKTAETKHSERQKVLDGIQWSCEAGDERWWKVKLSWSGTVKEKRGEECDQKEEETSVEEKALGLKEDLVWRVFLCFPIEGQEQTPLSGTLGASLGPARPLHYLWAPAHLEIKHLLICQKHKHEVLPISLTYKFSRQKNTVAHLIDENSGWWPEPPAARSPSLPHSFSCSDGGRRKREEGGACMRGDGVGRRQDSRSQLPIARGRLPGRPPVLICAHLSLCSLSP